MAKKTLLQHVQMLCREAGLSTPTKLTGDEEKRMTQYWNSAYVAVQNAWQDWRFMWGQYSADTVVGQASYSAPDDWGRWDHLTVRHDGELLDVCEYELVKTNSFASTSSTPVRAIIMPDGSLKLDPPPDSIKELTADYFKAARPLVNDGDLSIVPEAHENIIVWRAMVFYGDFEEAPMPKQAGIERYNEAIIKLESSQLLNNFGSRTRQSVDIQVVVE